MRNIMPIMTRARTSVIGVAEIAISTALGMVFCAVACSATEEEAEVGSAVDLIDEVLAEAAV